MNKESVVDYTGGKPDVLENSSEFRRASREDVWQEMRKIPFRRIAEKGVSYGDISDMNDEDFFALAEGLSISTEAKKEEEPVISDLGNIDGEPVEGEAEGSDEAEDIAPIESPEQDMNVAEIALASGTGELNADAVKAEAKEKKEASEKKKKFGRRVIAAALAMSILVGAGMFVAKQSKENVPTPNPTQVEQVQESAEFEIFDGSDYRDIFLDHNGTDYNSEKSGKYDMAPSSVLAEAKANHDEKAAREAIFDVAVRQPEVLAMIVSQFGEGAKAQLGIGEYDSVKDLEDALGSDLDLQSRVEYGFKNMMEGATLEFTTFSGNAVNHYMRMKNGGEVENNADAIELVRTGVKYYDNVSVVKTTFPDGTVLMQRDGCLQVLIIDANKVDKNIPVMDIEEETPTPDKPTQENPTPENPDTGDYNPENPTPDNPTPEKPTPEKPTPEKPTPEKPTPTGPPEELAGKSGDTHAEAPGYEVDYDDDLNDRDGDAPIVSEEDARNVDKGNEGYIGTGGNGSNDGNSGGQLPGSASDSNRVNPGTNGSGSESSGDINGTVPDYSAGLDRDSAGNANNAAGEAEAARGGGNGGEVKEGSNPGSAENSATGNFTNEEEEAIVSQEGAF